MAKWNYVYYLEIVKDDSYVHCAFSWRVNEEEALCLFILSNCNCKKCQ